MTQDNQHHPESALIEATRIEDSREAYLSTKKLLEAGEDPNQLDPTTGSSPLLEAWISGRIDIMRALIEAGADGQILSSLPFDLTWEFLRVTPEATLLLIESGFTLDSLYKRNQLDETVCNGENLIAFLLDAGRYDFIEALKPHGILNFIHAYDCLGNSPLGDMARDGHLEQAKWLLQRGVDVNAHCEYTNGSTALDKAVESANVDMTRLLLDAGANPNIPTWMWITATNRAVDFAADFEFRTKLSQSISNAQQIREMVLKASKKFPKPIYPNGTTPDTWPPLPKKK